MTKQKQIEELEALLDERDAEIDRLRTEIFELEKQIKRHPGYIPTILDLSASMLQPQPGSPFQMKFESPKITLKDIERIAKQIEVLVPSDTHAKIENKD